MSESICSVAISADADSVAASSDAVKRAHGDAGNVDLDETTVAAYRDAPGIFPPLEMV